MSRITSQEVTAVSTPLNAVRQYVTGVAPDGLGGFRFIAQLYNHGTFTAPEWIVMDLDTEDHEFFTGELLGGTGAYANTIQRILPQTAVTATYTADHTTEILTKSTHGLNTGNAILLRNTGGAVPTDLSLTAVYFVIRLTANTFKLAATFADALAGTAVTFSSNGTGTNKYSVVSNAQLRAPDGKIYYPCHGAHMWYYDPADEEMHSLGNLAHPAVTFWYDYYLYRSTFGHDGVLYSGSGCPKPPAIPMIVKCDTATMDYEVVGTIGTLATRSPSSTSLVYYIAADTSTAEKWIYACVGQNPWELCCINLDTLEHRVLENRPAAPGFMSFQYKPEGIVCNMTSPVEAVWCVDGVTYPYTEGYDPLLLPFTPRVVTPYSNPVPIPPEFDTTVGGGLISWRPNGSTDPFEEIAYEAPNAAPADIEAITGLPDGTILGQCSNYLGFFRYDPETDTSENYGAWAAGLSRGPRLVGSDGFVYMAGYPTVVLWKYDPNEEWDPPTNPEKLGNFTDSLGEAWSGGKYGHTMIESTDGKLYMSARRERQGIGSGLGSYVIATDTFDGTHAGLNFMDPRGLVVSDEHNELIFSGQLHDPPDPGQPTSAELVIFNKSFVELRRYTAIPGLQSHGVLYPTSDPDVIMGVTATAGMAYRFNFITGTLMETVTLVDYGTVGDSSRNPGGHVLVVLGDGLYMINPDNLVVTPICLLEAIVGLTNPIQPSRSIFLNINSELIEVNPRVLRSKKLSSVGRGLHYAKK